MYGAKLQREVVKRGILKLDDQALPGRFHTMVERSPFRACRWQHESQINPGVGAGGEGAVVRIFSLLHLTRPGSKE